MLAAFSPGSDFKRYYRGRMPRLALAVIIIMPLLYGALYLWAFWNPFNAVDKIPVALVNSDRGAMVQGKPLNAGEQVAQGLIASKQLDLHLVSEEDAKTGVAHGKYYFSITLPSDFSEAVASPASSNPRSADLVFTYNDANNYLSTVMGQDAAEQVVNKVSAQVGAQTFDIVFNDASGLMPKLKQAQAGVTQLNTGMQTANSGAHELATNLVTAKNGAGELAGGLSQLDNAVVTATDPILTAMNRTGNSGLSPAALNAAVNRLAVNADALNNQLTAATTTQSQASRAIDGVITQLQASPDPNIRGLADALTPARSFLTTQGLGPQANNQLTQVRTDSQVLSTQLGDAQSPTRIGLSLLQDGALRDDIVAARNAANQLSTGAEQLSTGLVELSNGANQLGAGTTQLAAGTKDLATQVDAGVKAVPHWSQEQQDSLASTLSKPVALKERTLNEAKTFGTGFTPFFFGLALFVGSIIAWMLFTPLQSRPIAQGLNSLRVVLASYAPTFFVGVLQAAILYLVVVFAVGLRPAYPIATFGFMLLMVAVFLAMIQMFNALFGPAVGRVVTLAFLMIMLTSAGGIYPVPTTTKPFQYIHWVDPMTYTVTGLRQLTVGGIDHRFWIATAVLITLTAACLAVSTWAARRNRQYNMDRLYPPVEV